MSRAGARKPRDVAHHKEFGDNPFEADQCFVAEDDDDDDDAASQRRKTLG